MVMSNKMKLSFTNLDINSNITTNKTIYKIQQYLAFLTWQFIEGALLTLGLIVLVFFVDTKSVTIIISSHSVIEVSAISFKYYSHKYLC